MRSELDPEYVKEIARRCLQEDIGDGDLTALVAVGKNVRAKLVCRQAAVICGLPFFDQVFSLLDSSISIQWRIRDGDEVSANAVLCKLGGPSRAILSGERSALNLLQTLSGTATMANRFVREVQGTGCEILDTRKTIPGLRRAQKWAVRCGGGVNHRHGLYDGVLLKENHLRTGESITEALRKAMSGVPSDVWIEVEVENLDQFQEAIDAGASRVLLDNFSLRDLTRAVAVNAGRARLEASGNIHLENVKAVARTGVDCISVGAITKNIEAVDLSLLFEPD